MVELGKVLIVEDDDFKADEIKDFIGKKYSILTLKRAKSVQQAVAIIHDDEFNVVILDMSLPSHNVARGEGSPVSFLSGGVEVLSEIIDSGRAEKIIILTQFTEIEFNGALMSHKDFIETIQREQGYRLLDVIYFQRNTDAWKHRFSDALRNIQ